jgi:hypothetical protein
MASKRKTIDRLRRPQFTAEILALFATLESTDVDCRGSEWQRQSRRLSQLLGDEFEDAWLCGGLDVCDPGLEQDRPGFWGAEPRTMVLAMRAALLAAITKPPSRVAVRM